MKNFKLILLVFVAVLLSNVMMAQQAATETKTEVVKKTKKKSAKKVAKETASAVAQMDEKQQQMILNYTRNLSKSDTKKEMMKAMKKMSAEDQQKVLDYMSTVTKTAEVKPEIPAVANVKPEVPPSVVKDKVKPDAKPKEETTPVDPATLTKIEILESTIDFGTIPQGESAKATYKVKNVGDKPLIITKAKGSCGCTVPEWPKDAIAPGGIAEIKVVFNSKGKKGKQNKRITITANTDPADSFMTITGTVEEPAGAPDLAPAGTEEQKGN